MQDVALAVVFVATILALYIRPFGAHDWQIALTGAVLAWPLAPLGVRDGIAAVSDSANIVVFFLGLMLIAAGAEAAGLYGRVTDLIRGQASEKAALLTVLVAGSAVTAILSNDATPLILTPAIFAAGLATDPATRRTALGATFTADGASLLLPVSNPVNLLFFERFDMRFAHYLGTITPAAAAGLGALALVVWWRAKPAVPQRPSQAPVVVVRDTRPALAAIGVVAIAYVGAGFVDIPLSGVTLGGGVLLLVAARVGGPVSSAAVRRHIAPGVLVFVASLLLLVECVAQAGLLNPVEDLLGALQGRPSSIAVLGAAALAAILANLVNNWPAALILAAALGGLQGDRDALVAGALIGSAIGANFTMVGSLSTVFWLSLARRAGADFGHAEYARSAFAPTLAALIAASVVAAFLV